MSIQSEIDKNLSKDGKFMRTITISGESGSASVPSNCYVTFNNCSIGDLSVASNCSIVIGQSSVGTVIMQGGTLTMDSCQITGEVKVTGTRVTQSLCSAVSKTTVSSGASLEGYSNSRNGGGDAGIEATGNSRVILSSETFSGFLTAVKITNGSFGSMRQCKLIGVLKGVDVQDNSQAEVFGGQVIGEQEVGAKAINSKILLAAITEASIMGGITGILAENGAEVRATNCDNIKGDEYGIMADGEGTVVDVLKFIKIKGDGNSAIKIDNGAKVSCRKGDEITSPASDAVLLKNSTFLSRSVKSINSKAANAFKSDDESVINLFDVAIEVRGYGANGISAGKGDSYEITNCPLLKGDAGHGISAGDECKFILRNIQLVQGLSGHGISTGASNLIDLRSVDKVIGQSGHGINTGNKLQLTSSTVDTIQGTSGHGLLIGSSCNIRCADTMNVIGLTGTGIQAGAGCAIEFNGFTTIHGLVVSGIEAPSGKVTLTNGSKVVGENNNGINAPGKGGVVFLRNIAEVRGKDGNGVRVSQGTVDIRNVGIISAGANGLALDSSVAVVDSVTKLAGDEVGIKATGSSKCTATNISTISGTTSGVEADSSEILLTNIKSLTGSPNAIKGINNSRISCSIASITGGVGIEGGSDVSLNGCDILGNLEVDEGVATLVRVSVKGDATVTKSSFIGTLFSATGSITLDESGAVFTKGSSSSMIIVSSGVIASNSSFGDVSMSHGGHIHAQGAATIQGTGSAILAEAGTFHLPIAGMQGVSGDLNIRGVTITSSTV